MDQFYINYNFPSSSSTQTTIQPPSKPILTPQEIQSLQSQSQQIILPTLVRSYISSLLIALRLHPAVISTSISSRAVQDIRNLIRVSSLRQAHGWNRTNAEGVPKAIELCTSFRLRTEADNVTYHEILKE